MVLGALGLLAGASVGSWLLGQFWELSVVWGRTKNKIWGLLEERSGCEPLLKTDGQVSFSSTLSIRGDRMKLQLEGFTLYIRTF